MPPNEKITVLYICGSGFSGAEKSLLDLITSVADYVNPIVLVPSIGETFEVFTNRGIHCICHRYSDSWIPFGHWIKFFVFPWRLKTIKYFRYDIPCVYFVKGITANQHVDLIHTNYSLTAFGTLLSRRVNLPHVWHVREYLIRPYIKGRIFMGRFWLRKMINNASARIVSSTPCSDFWQLKKDNTYMINDAVRRVKECCYIKEKQKYVLFCSSIVRESKGIFTAIHAYSLSGLNALGIRLRVVGKKTCEIEKQISSMVSEYKCADMVDFIPEQKNVKPLFANAMAYINPSVSEGMGRTTAEAMFYGCPVVARASGGTLDLIKHGETGWLFNTEKECAELLNLVCSTSQEQIILRAQEFAKQNLSIENYGDKIMEVYHKVLNN